jgi:hypothetical protein
MSRLVTAIWLSRSRTLPGVVAVGGEDVALPCERGEASLRAGGVLGFLGLHLGDAPGGLLDGLARESSASTWRCALSCAALARCSSASLAAFAASAATWARLSAAFAATSSVSASCSRSSACLPFASSILSLMLVSASR